MAEKEIRLIDARKISNDIALYLAENSYLNDTALDALKMVARWVNEAPTIDLESLRPHGKWILEREPDGKPYCFHCSVCDTDFHYIGITVAYDYCPNCGAKMEE